MIKLKLLKICIKKMENNKKSSNIKKKKKNWDLLLGLLIIFNI